MKIYTKNKTAFTMLELIFVIVVLGILASLAMPRLERDLQQEAADSILSDIRYTQHLAITDFKHDFNEPKWQQKFWRILFSNCGTDLFYMIGSDESMDSSTSGNFARTESATDPANGKPMFYACTGVNKEDVSKRIFITDKYGIKTVTPSADCTGGGDYIGFDHLGRLHHGFSASTTPDYSSTVATACTFTFIMNDDSNFSISIEPETGYAQIVTEDDS